MKVLLASLNSKYIHTNLAIRYLYESAQAYHSKMELKEFTINHNEDYIYSEILRGKYDIVCFSCYIWNITQVLSLTSDIKRVQKDTIIILGGPEVSFESEAFINNHAHIDYIIRGEGEKAFIELLKALMTDHHEEIENIKGITYRENKKIIKTPDRELIENLDEIPFPYKHFFPEKDKIIYYETSRGCSFRCSYCMSSVIKSVRYFSLERVKKELDFFIKKEVHQVKLVDRTFNLNPDRCIEIIKYIVQKDQGKTNFHFEINGDLLNQDIIDYLKNVRIGLFQFEIGVQSTCNKTLEAVNRKMNFEKLKKNVYQINANRNIHLHLDLIAGLPYEDYNTFKKSFNDVYLLQSQNLQLGFLKLLKGAQLRNEIEKHQYIFREKEPYEVLSNAYLSSEEVIKLKMIENVLDKYHNRPGFRNTINYIINSYYDSPFDFYSDLANYWYQNGFQHMAHGKDALYRILQAYYTYKGYSNIEGFKEFLLFDRLLIAQLGKDGDEQVDLNKTIHDILHDNDFREGFIPKYQHLKVKEIKKKIGFRVFNFNIYGYIYKNEKLKLERNLCFFDYGHKNADDQARVEYLSWDYFISLRKGDETFG